MSDALPEPTQPEPEPVLPFDPQAFRTAPLADRGHRVDVNAFATPIEGDATVPDFLDSLPDMLGVKSLRGLSQAIANAQAGGHSVLWGLGGHVIKVGLGPLLADLHARGFARGFVMNGAAAIHDAEIALRGSTSEDVGAGLFDGTYGSSDETGRLFAEAAHDAASTEVGFGTALARAVQARGPQHADRSLLCYAAEHNVPVTVHVAIGTDTVHMHPACSGADVGAATHKDFLRLVTLVNELDQGVYVNVGSAVVLPEVFMKTVAMAHNARATASQDASQANAPERIRIVTGNLDMLRHYRTRVNVIQRPAVAGYEITGQHEILLPLLRMAVLHEAAKLRASA